MFNFFKKFETIKPFEQERQLAMKKLIDTACENAITEEEFDEYQSIYLKKLDDISDDEVDRFDELDLKVEASKVLCNNLNDFKYALEYFGVDDPIDLLAHENAHANKAEQLGVDFEGYYLKIMKCSDGHYHADIGADIDISGKEFSWSKDRQKEADIDITRAPYEYGNKMSADDIDRLDRIEEMYKEE